MAVQQGDPTRLLDQIENLSRTHREHELFYSQAPLEDAVTLQQISRTLKALAGHWRTAMPLQVNGANRYAGCDLNVQAAIEQTGVLFLEGEGEPGEISRLKRELATQAADHEQTGLWLGEAMRSTWATAAKSLLQIEPLADLLAERHRIIAANWRNAYLSTIIAALLVRANEILDRIEFTPAALRADLAGQRLAPRYLYSAAELIDHAADLLAEGAVLVHESERRWRVFSERVETLRADRSERTED